MRVYIKIKALAKRKPIIANEPFIIDKGIATSKDLIEHVVCHMVKAYNDKELDTPLLSYLTDDKITNGAKTGKIGFDERRNENVQDEKKAVENALTCFEDGIFRMFINNEEIEINQSIQIKDGDEITFIRLTMLAGRLW